MLFTYQPLTVEDLSNLPEHERRLFNPKPFTDIQDLSGSVLYGYLRERADEHGPKGSLYYIGEGCRERVLRHHRCKVPSPANIVIFIDASTKKDVRFGEEILIRYYGRISRGNGILTNIKHKCGGSEDPPPPRKVEACQYCGKLGKHISYHESRCEKNPNHIKGTKTLSYTKCQYCQEKKTLTQISNHERCCEKNPNATGYPLVEVNCRFCGQVSNQCGIKQHERVCKDNPDRIEHNTTGTKYDKKACKFCSKEVSGNNIAIHERHCHSNPERIPGNRAGKTKNSDK